MNLFDLKNWKLEIKPEAFTIKAFKVLIDRDKSKDKNIALQELAYIYHMCDNMSPSASFLDEESRHNDVIKKVIKVKNWKPDNAVKEAMEVYKEMEETVTSRYLESVKIALSKVDKYFREFEDPDSASIKRVDDMIKGSMNTVKSVRELEKLVKQDKESSDILRGGRTKGLFMDE
jgi:transcriptional regulator with PAS, ATPase and Fis domain